jgi:beta-lactamase regulating signal transducer with metallopeptidase domain
MNTNEPVRKGPIARLTGFAAIILVLAVVGGVVSLFYDYVMQYRAESWSEREESARRVERDKTSVMKRRFTVGAGCGAVIGVIYVFRCLRRHEDP